MRVLAEYFAQAGEVTIENAWEHVYRCLLWKNEAAGLAHIYDSNHMQEGGVFHARAVRFTEELCRRWNVSRADLWGQIDFLFKGCVAELRRQAAAKAEAVGTGLLLGEAEDAVGHSELTAQILELLHQAGLDGDGAAKTATAIEALARDYLTIGNKRKNALGEGFEDLLYLLLTDVAGVPESKVALRQSVSQLPGFRKLPPAPKGQKRPHQPKPDLALVEGGITHVITTAKWSIRQDRQRQFASEFDAYQKSKIQSTELRFSLITNEFDIARLSNDADAIPTGVGGYIFHNIYHINLEMLEATHGGKLGRVGGHIATGKIRSLSDFLAEMKGQFA